MSDLQVIGPFDWNGEYTHAFAPTNDPRVFAGIARDPDPWAPDGDCYGPAYYVDYRRYGHCRLDNASTYADDTVADAYADALSHFDGDTDLAARYMRIFFDTHVHAFSGGYRNETDMVIFDSPAWRNHFGIPASTVLTEGDMTSEWRYFLDGEVFLVGYSVVEERVMDCYPVDLDVLVEIFEVTCGGYYGQGSAREASAAFENSYPELHPLLDLTPATSTL